MVSQVATHAGEMPDDGDFQGAELIGRSYAREQEYVRCSYGARTEDDLLSVELAVAIRGSPTDSNGPCSIEGHLMHQGVGNDGQVFPAPGRSQVSYCRTHPGAAVDVESQGSDPGGAGPVVVRAIRKYGVQAGLVEGALLRPPFAVGVPPAGYWPGVPVELVPKVLVVFQLDQVGQDVLKSPPGVAPLGPEIKVFRHGPEELGIVDGTGASGDPAPGTSISASAVALARKFQM